MDMTEVKQLNEALFQEKSACTLRWTPSVKPWSVLICDENYLYESGGGEDERLDAGEALGVPLLTVLHITFGDNGP